MVGSPASCPLTFKVNPQTATPARDLRPPAPWTCWFCFWLYYGVGWISHLHHQASLPWEWWTQGLKGWAWELRPRHMTEYKQGSTEHSHCLGKPTLQGQAVKLSYCCETRKTLTESWGPQTEFKEFPNSDILIFYILSYFGGLPHVIFYCLLFFEKLVLVDC